MAKKYISKHTGKEIDKAIDSILDIVEKVENGELGGGGEGDPTEYFSSVRKKVYALSISNRTINDITPLEVKYEGDYGGGLKIYSATTDANIILASSTNDFPSDLLNKEITSEAFAILETIASKGKYQFFIKDEDSASNIILYDDGINGVLGCSFR